MKLPRIRRPCGGCARLRDSVCRAAHVVAVAVVELRQIDGGRRKRKCPCSLLLYGPKPLSMLVLEEERGARWLHLGGDVKTMADSGT